MKRTVTILLCLSLTSLLLLSACLKKPELGTEENPIVWSFVPSGEKERVAAGAQSLIGMLQEKTGLFFESDVAADYTAVLKGLSADPPTVHMASLATFAYILAAERDAAEAALVSIRRGSPIYRAQLIARRGSGIRKITDLKGKTFCRPDPLSTSGWVIPMLTMRAAGINPENDLKEILDLGTHDSVVAAVYNGDVDAGSTYEDARTLLQEEHPDVMQKVVVINVSIDIPNDGVQFVPAMPQEKRKIIVKALLEIAETDEGKEALGTAYQWEALEEHDDSFYNPFRQVLQASGLGIDTLQR
ncbi:MAG: phosphate/phosphite/phosphonate ABC transporter substrate-binding protein [Spirochaetaceae bacterium]|nr:MAG: phosphate/phosphite/phosphonate ABC transporter substrate-binding protein [Spirochaetaceae bacterium]